MADFKEMYYTLAVRVASIIEDLQAAMRETEQMYTIAEDPEIYLLRKTEPEKD
ncbi:MAG: hypothetical protein FWE69_03565 [Clostridiales bacterium]|nr:hypothetical protein [Clostridiales bacterium]